MKKILMTCAALATLAAAAPASAQRWDGDYGNFDRREARAERQIEWCRGISPWEARELRNELRQIEVLEQRYRYGGLNGWEYQDLERRMDRLERHIRRECTDGDRYGDRYGRGYRDHDRDGVPDRFDHHDPYGDFDRDGIPNRWDRFDRGH